MLALFSTYSPVWFPACRLITLRFSALNSILPFVSRLIEEILVLVNLLRLCPVLGPPYTKLSLPSAHCKAGVMSQTSAASHLHSVSEDQAHCFQSPTNTLTALKHVAAQQRWQPLAMVPEMPVTQTILTTVPTQQRHERAPGWSGWQVSEGGPARMLCCWWCQSWAALATWACGAPLCCLDYTLQRSWNSPKNSLLPAWKVFICAYCLIPALELVLIQQPLLPPLPLPFALAINLWCGTLWNALWNSKRTAEFPLSSLAVISSKNSRRLVKYDLL